MNTTKKTVLVVEDEKPIAHALDLKLQHAGFATIIAHDGEEGLQKLEDEEVDLIILDLVMPKVDGFSFLEKKKSETPVFVLSNLSQEEDIEKVKKLGVEGFFIKSNIKLEDVIEKINEILK